MTNRFNAGTVWRAHLKGLRNRNYAKPSPDGRPDVVGRSILYGLPALTAATFVYMDWYIEAPEALLAGYALLAGAFLAIFAPLAAWRDRLTERADREAITAEPVRDFLDSTVAHTCLASLVSAGLVAVLIVAMNFADHEGRVVSGWAAATAAGGVYLFLLLVLIVKSLYAAYAQVNEVRDSLSGLHRG